MKILIHIPSDSLQYIFGVEKIINEFCPENEVIVVCQKAKVKKEDNFLILSLLRKIKAHISIEKKHFKLASKKNQIFKCIKNRFSAFFLDKYSRIYTAKKNEDLSNYFKHKVSNKNKDFILINNFNDEQSLIKELKPDFLLMFGGPFISSKILNKFKIAINVHLGWIPKYKGSRTVEWAIINNDFEHIGATIHIMTEKMDGGSVIWRTKFDQEIDFKNFGRIHARLFEKSFEQLPKIVNKFMNKEKVNEVVVSKDEKERLYYGFEFDYKFYKKMVNFGKS